VFATYFEIARSAYWRDALGYASFDDCPFIIARVEVNYRSQARLGELLDVRTRLSRIGTSSFAIDYEVVEASDGRLVADGKSVQVMFDYQAQRSRPVPEDFRVRVARFEGAVP
jgi:acyl-CoA thioester hydrolase